VVDKIARPALVVHAADDPFIRLLPETRKKMLANPCITLLEPDHGGHCAFLAHPNGYDGRWAERQIVHFFQQCFSASLLSASFLSASGDGLNAG